MGGQSKMLAGREPVVDAELRDVGFEHSKSLWVAVGRHD